MSMNLHCKGFNLWQTPTQITYMCMVGTKGEVHYEQKGKKALHALRIYEQWVMNSLNGAWESTEALNDAQEAVNDHVKKLNYFIKCNKSKLEVYIL